MNTIIRNNKEYKLIGFWDDTNNYDSKGKKFIVPKENKSIWLQKSFFMDKLILIQLLLKQQESYKKYTSSTYYESLIAANTDMRNKLSWYPFISQVLTTTIIIIVSYLTQKRFTFKTR